MDSLLVILDILIGVLAALVLLVGAINLVGFWFQVRAGEEDLKKKWPTVLMLKGVILFGLSELVDFAFSSDLAGIIRKCIVALALALVLCGVYLGLEKHATRYLDSKGEPRAVAFGPTERIRKKLEKKKK